MTDKSFLEILSEKIEKQILNDVSQGKKASNNQSAPVQNVDNCTESSSEEAADAALHSQWISQIPLGKIHFQAPKQQVFGRIYPINIPKAKPATPAPERKKHVLSEIQKQAVVYFWGWQIRLQEDFTSQELKKAFRTLAHRLHPDRNDGKTKQYLELKSKYDCLLSVF